MKAWSHLPNSHHIDWVIESLKQNPWLWAEVRALGHLVKDAVRVAAWNEACAAAIAMSRVNEVADAMHASVVWWPNSAGFASAVVRMGLVPTASGGVAQGAILVLAAYDDCDQYLNMGYEKLKMYAMISEKPQAILLLPMVYVREKLGIETVENKSISV